MDTIRKFALEVDSGRKKSPVSHRGIQPALAACRSEALPTELHPDPRGAVVGVTAIRKYTNGTPPTLA